MTGAFALLFWLTVVLYALMVGAQIFGQVFGKPAWLSRALWGVLAALALHTGLIAWRWIETGHAPVIGNFENALVGAWFIAAMAVWAGWRKLPLVAAGSLPFALLILGFGAASGAEAVPMLAALKSFWLWIHVFFAWLAYGAYTIGAGAAVVYLVRSRKGKEAPKELLERLDELMYRATIFGFITDAIMIAAGSIWAKSLWGSYWGWDPVETWSLLSWVVHGVALHLRATMGWRGRRFAWYLAFAIVTVLMTFWGVNLVMDQSKHVFNVG